MTLWRGSKLSFLDRYIRLIVLAVALPMRTTHPTLWLSPVLREWVRE